MLLIPCPHCGARAQVEFAYGGDATKRRPPDGAPDEAWYDYVYLRGNPRGPHREWWLHHAGCGRWIQVTRDTATHEVLGAVPAVGPPGGGALGARPDSEGAEGGLAIPGVRPDGGSGEDGRPVPEAGPDSEGERAGGSGSAGPGAGEAGERAPGEGGA